jgi:L-threonylcarbamoyladenylate synthase
MSDIDLAATILRRGGLVAFPTETVYGLGADATNAQAVRRIFAVKGRPGTNPIIVHVADAEVARRYARHWPAAAGKLARAFWPGPLTLVVPKADAIVSDVTASLDSVGLRAPNHPLALELLRAFGGAIAAPSANRSNHVSPTTAQHVSDELGDQIDLVLDGGPCMVGIESTVLDLASNHPRILRPGAITREQIESVIGPVTQAHTVTEVITPSRAPGQHARHYAPHTPAFRFDASHRGAIPEDRVAVMMLGTGPLHEGERVVTMPRDPSEYARHFYRILRQLDARKLDAIFIEIPPDLPEWTAVRDRLIRATRPFHGTNVQ